MKVAGHGEVCKPVLNQNRI